MRCVLALLAALSASTMAAQEPDTTDWHRYFPLEVGNEWHYLVDNGIFGPNERISWEVVEDVAVNDTTFYRIRSCREIEGQKPTCGLGPLYVLDDDHGAVMSRSEDAEGNVIYRPWFIQVCRLDSPFGNVGSELCFLGIKEANVDGAYDSNFNVGGDTVVGTHKIYIWIGGVTEFVAGIGFARDFPDGGGSFTTIRYARIAGIEYGNPLVSNEGDEAPRQRSPVRTYPNPTSESVSIQFTLNEPQIVRIDVFNLQGALLESRMLGARVDFNQSLDTSSWPSGAYQIRLTGDRGFSETRGIIVIR